jgi:DNA topoisomerase-2
MTLREKWKPPTSNQVVDNEMITMLSRLTLRGCRPSLLAARYGRLSSWKGSLPSGANTLSISNTIGGNAGPQQHRFSSSGLLVERSIEEQYSRKTPLEHVLLRPGMYVGPNERLPPQDCWVLEQTPSVSSTSDSSTQTVRMVKKEYGLVPALGKVFDEILVNAHDNKQRHPKSCTRIDVVIDPGSADHDACIQVLNDGIGIPIQIHKEEGMYVPEMLFGHLLTGSNFDDTEKRLTGGRHGYGAKLANIFSKSFTVETLNAKKKLKYRQTWTDNMTMVGEPEITKVSDEKDYTRITFVPDLPRLTGDPNARMISQEDYAIMCRRVVDVAGVAAGKLNVTLNGLDVTMASFADYAQLYRTSDASTLCFQKINPRWMVGVGLSESGSFEAVSFVNGMSTSRGGTHINVLVLQLCKQIQDEIERIDSELGPMVSTGLIRRHLFVCCDALIENPSFDSQMKEYLTSSPTSFGSSCALNKPFLRNIVKSVESGGPGIVEEIIRVAKGRQQAELLKKVGGKKTKRQLLSIHKLEDAHKAGSSGNNCTLILTEGDSAKALAVAGLEIIGRDQVSVHALSLCVCYHVSQRSMQFGVFPLRGKFLNVRSATATQLTNNEELKSICSILGLDFDKEYDTEEERRSLRYQRLLLMVDQDLDGSHIVSASSHRWPHRATSLTRACFQKGLIINLFRHFWPKLLKPPMDKPMEEAIKDPPFLSSFITPLLKATKKGKKKTLSFYSMAEYQAWRAGMDNDDIKKWSVKYYKGLGTSTPAEAKVRVRIR